MAGNAVARCRSCGAEITVVELYHAGKGDEIFLYCDRDDTVLTFSWYDPTYERIVHREPIGPNPFDLTEEEQRRVEDRLIECPCGGRFSFKNPLRCPLCGGIFSDPPRLSFSEVVVVINRRIDGNETPIWKNRRNPV